MKVVKNIREKFKEKLYYCLKEFNDLSKILNKPSEDIILQKIIKNKYI